MTNTTKAPSGQTPGQRSNKTLTPRLLLVVLLVVIATCFAFIVLEMPFMEHFKFPAVRLSPMTSISKTPNDSRISFSGIPGAVDRPEHLPDSTTQELLTLDTVIEQFNKDVARSPGSVESYFGDHNVMTLLNWVLGKIVELSNKIKDNKSQIEKLKTFKSMETSGMNKKFIKTSEITKNSGKSKKVKLQPKVETPASKVGDAEGHIAETKQQTDKKTGPVARPRLVLFSTWRDKPEKRQAHDNVLRTWRLWEPLVIPLVFTNDTNIASRARTFGWRVLREPRAGCTGQHGVPLLREMFRSAMANFDSHLYAYVNGDLLLGNGLLSTIEAIVKNKELMGKPLLGLINRINVDFYHKKREPVYTLQSFNSLVSDGRAMTDGSSDGFITNKRFPWQHVPDIVPGRKGVAMWLVSYAREMGAATVDVSGTLRAIHMMATQAGKDESKNHPGYK
ncbi:hypothetical protein ElyMa_002659400 [Elysia marginata]|uniref:Uncharacterized protein n=1 Tax=Elysia marginata TaxID=1093978 RepID=A0AAV4H8M4_9GAST|nr:hypothetical protein ElyMa_002659400 [Elysia marginata]